MKFQILGFLNSTYIYIRNHIKNIFKKWCQNVFSVKERKSLVLTGTLNVFYITYLRKDKLTQDGQNLVTLKSLVFSKSTGAFYTLSKIDLSLGNRGFTEDQNSS